MKIGRVEFSFTFDVTYQVKEGGNTMEIKYKKEDQGKSFPPSSFLSKPISPSLSYHQLFLVHSNTINCFIWNFLTISLVALHTLTLILILFGVFYFITTFIKPIPN